MSEVREDVVAALVTAHQDADAASALVAVQVTHDPTPAEWEAARTAVTKIRNDELLQIIEQNERRARELRQQ